MTITSPPYTGSCLCGAVKVHLTAYPLLTLACHCRDCQKLTASAFSMTSMFPGASFSCTGNLRLGGRRKAGQAHYFCKSCRGFVYSQIGSALHRVNLRTSVLDDSAAFAPFVELMTDEKVPWIDLPAVHSFAQVPETIEVLEDLMRDYADLNFPKEPTPES